MVVHTVLDRLALSLVSIRERVGLLRWLVPLVLFLLVILYEAGPARWTAAMGSAYHVVVEVVLFALVGPTLAFLFLDLTQRWLEERDTSDLQSQMVANAQADAEASRALCDDAVQAIFSAGTLLASLKADLPADDIGRVEQVEVALDGVVRDLREHLQTTPES